MWVRLDDKLHSHPKVLALFDGGHAESALALWLLAASWSGDQLTDGVIPRVQVRRLGFTVAAAEELVRVGLWCVCDEGWAFHDWLTYNPSREHVLARQTAAREKKQRQREAARSRRSGPEADEPDEDVSPGLSPGDIPGCPPGCPPGKTRLSPNTRPDPTLAENNAARELHAALAPVASLERLVRGEGDEQIPRDLRRLLDKVTPERATEIRLQLEREEREDGVSPDFKRLRSLLRRSGS